MYTDVHVHERGYTDVFQFLERGGVCFSGFDVRGEAGIWFCVGYIIK